MYFPSAFKAPANCSAVTSSVGHIFKTSLAKSVQLPSSCLSLSSHQSKSAVSIDATPPHQVIGFGRSLALLLFVRQIPLHSKHCAMWQSILQYHLPQHIRPDSKRCGMVEILSITITFLFHQNFPVVPKLIFFWRHFVY